jgi:hypothetical protein
VKQHLIEKNEYARSAINTIYGLDAEEASKISGWCVVAAKLASSDQSMDFRLTGDNRAEPHAIHTAQGPGGRNMSSNSSSGDATLPSSLSFFVLGTDAGPCTMIARTRPFVKANRMAWKYSKFPHASGNEGHMNMDAGAIPETIPEQHLRQPCQEHVHATHGKVAGGELQGSLYGHIFLAEKDKGNVNEICIHLRAKEG